MKKLKSLAFLFVISGSVAACQNDNASESAAAPTAEPAPQGKHRGERGERGERKGNRPDRAAFDSNGDGTLDESERAAMRQGRLDRMFTELDADADGALSKAEVEAGDGRMTRVLSDFDALDADKSGALSKEEVGAALEKRGGKRGPRGPRGGAPNETE